MTYRSRVFLWGFGLSVPFYLVLLVSGWFLPLWIVLVVTNPTILLAALAFERLPSHFPARYDQVIGVSALILESAFWWYVVAGVADVVRRRRQHHGNERAA
jgi:hypothetical protein